MKCKASLTSVRNDWKTGKIKVELILDYAESLENLIKLIGSSVRLEIVKWRDRRSLDANAYYWSLLSEFSDVMRFSKSYAHNYMLRKYGQYEMIDGHLVYFVLPDSDNGEKIADESQTYHIKPTSEVKFSHDGDAFRTYIVVRGSHTYDTKEMSKLIDGLVSECKEQGIETLPPEELERMMQAYEQNRRKR